MTCGTSSARSARRERGFTLIELMVVVAIVGVLATLATVGYRRYISSSKASEAIYMVGSIRAAEESYRAETLQYLGTNWPTLYPMATPSKVKHSWDSNSDPATANLWQQLGVRSDGPVYFGYTVAAGGPGSPVETPHTKTTPDNWPKSSAEPWYVAEAKGDLDGDGVIFSYVLGSSFTGDLYIENQGE